QEGLVVAEDGLAFGEAGERVHTLLGQPYHRTQLAQPGVVLIRLQNRTGSVDIRAVGRNTLTTQRNWRHRRTVARKERMTSTVSRGASNGQKCPVSNRCTLLCAGSISR